jgi:peptidoglycan/LPS O-acetylase OafA/YrhL
MAILYIQNYADFGKGCMTQTWYLSVDMQLSWMAPLLIIPLYYVARAGRQLSSLVLLASCFIPFTVAYMNELHWTYHGWDFFSNFAYTVLMYFPTHTRASPYVWGVIFGHILYITRDKQVSAIDVDII